MSPKYLSKFQLKPSVWVFVPTPTYVDRGREIKQAVENHWKAPVYFYHLRKGGHVQALNAHIANKYFLHLDIKNFFSSINTARVTRNLKGLFSYPLAREFAVDSTVRHPETKKFVLPFGFIQSPILASLCLHKSALGACLFKYAQEPKYAVSVYVDDIIISANCPELLVEAKDRIKEASLKSRLELNPKKEEGPDEIITAFNIELSQHSMLIAEDRFEQLVGTYQSTGNQNVKFGIAGYISTINTVQLGKLTK